MSKGFVIELSSDLDFEGMVVEISYDNQTIARLNYEKGVDNIEIEFVLCDKSMSKLIFPLNDFLVVVEKAKKLVMQCAEEDKFRE